MNPEQEFDRRMAAMHGRGLRADAVPFSGARTPVDVRHEEYAAMVDVFLGADFDAAKRKQVEDLQIVLHQQDVALYRRFHDGELSAEQYVDEANALLDETARKCEEILGAADFEKLFGAPRAELTGMIDREAFLAANKGRNL